MYHVDIHYLGSYRQLSTSQQLTLQNWIQSHVRNKHLWSKTSYGLKCWFEKSPGGFALTSGQFKFAMLKAGYRPQDYLLCDDWIFLSMQKTRSNRQMQ